jgi:hypothetical protein
MAVSTARLEAERLSQTFARLLGGSAPPGPGDLLGLEHEYSLERNRRAIDFGVLIHRLGVPGRRLDPADPNSYRCDWGGVITCDGAEAEIASPPVPTRPGFAEEVERWAGAGLSALLSLLPPGISLRGFSTHLSAAVPEASVDATALLYIERFAAPLMLLLDRRDSPGLLVRPRPGRLELGGEYANGEALRAAATFVAGSVRATATAVLRHTLEALPPAISLTILPSAERFGWYVDRRAYGADLYAEGRSTPLRLADGRRTTAQDQLSAAWSVARDALAGRATRAELALVDDLVDGTRPLRVEGEDASAHAVFGSLSTASPRGGTRDAHGAILDEIVRPAFRARVRVAMWTSTVFEVTTAARTVFMCVPRGSLDSFLRRMRAGELDGTILAYAEAGSTQRRLDHHAATRRAGLHDSLGPVTGLAAPERAPLISAGAEVRPGKRQASGPSTVPHPRRYWPRRLAIAAAIGVVFLGGVVAISTFLPTEGPTPTPTPTPRPAPPEIRAVQVIDFGAAFVTNGGSGSTRRIRVRNVGGAPLRRVRGEIDGVAAADFVVADNNCRQPATGPGRVCAISLTFRPSQTGRRRARLSILSQGLDPYRVKLTGVGRLLATPEPTRVPTPRPRRTPPATPRPTLELEFVPNPVLFGKLGMDEPPSILLVTATSVGGGRPLTLHADDLSLVSDDSDGLTLSLAKCTDFQFTAAGQECPMEARFGWTQDSTTGEHSATYHVRTTSGVYSITLQGTFFDDRVE